MMMADLLDRDALLFGSYRVLKEIGRGGVARVYRAEHAALGRLVAIKAVDVRSDLPPVKLRQLAARLLREGRTATLLRHPHVVDVLDIGEQNGVPYLVMELVEGGTFAALLEERQKLPLAELAALMLPLIDAVIHSHHHGVVHRDLKPENVLLCRDVDGAVSPKLSDFGVCRSLSSHHSEQLTSDGGLVGTLAYMAPEQLRAPRAAGPAADQYALGAIMYRAATGRLPFLANDPVVLMQQISAATILPPRMLEPALPEGFSELVMRALAREPAERFVSVLALGEALLRLSSGAVWSTWAGKLGASTRPSSQTTESGVMRAASTTWTDSHDSVSDVPSEPTPPALIPTSRGRSWSLLAVAALPLIAIGVLSARGGASEETTPRVMSSLPESAPKLAASANAIEVTSYVVPSPVEKASSTGPLPSAQRRQPKGRSAPPASARARELSPHDATAVAATSPKQTAPRVEVGSNGAPILQ